LNEKPVLLELSDNEKSDDILLNRIRKNYKHIRKWCRRTSSDCFRLYDRDIPSFPLAIDYYAGKLCIQYFARNREDSKPDNDFEESVNKSVNGLFSEECETVWKYRIKREKFQQYEKLSDSKHFFTVLENSHKFLINLHDYLDTGLFLDHKDARLFVSKFAKDRKVLNLFSYTSSFSVYAAKAGAKSTLSVDMSNTYTEWSRNNFEINGINTPANRVLREDCIKFLKSYSGEKFDLIIIDPPTISRSKKMDSFFDVNIDYPFLINSALKNLNKGGMIFFSTNSRTIKLDTGLLDKCSAEDVSEKTIPFDFKDKKIHRAWLIKHEDK